jgi:hypothetical protein
MGRSPGGAARDNKRTWQTNSGMAMTDKSEVGALINGRDVLASKVAVDRDGYMRYGEVWGMYHKSCI